VSVPEAEQRKLFVRSGNRCAFADCRRLLTAEGSPPDRLVVLGEMAHIVAEQANGPRGNFPLPLSECNRAENLILLCNTHHQLIDSQPQTYTVERLLGMKEAHEQWVEKALDAKGSITTMRPPLNADVVHSTLLPVEQMPKYIYGGRCELSEGEVQRQLRPLRHGEMAPYIVRGKRLYAFQDLAEAGNPFELVMGGQKVTPEPVRAWWENPDRLGWFLQLLNRALNKLTGRRGLQLDREHRRYYFAPSEPGVGLAVTYRPLNQRRKSRPVVWQPKRKSTGEPRSYWYHRAVALKFLRVTARSWVLSIRPELRITVDGMTPLAAEAIGGKVTRKKSRTFNYDLLGEVQFWRDYLSESKPRILLPFGRPGQAIVIPTTLMQGDVTWPGIPKEHAKLFKNVEYLDDLFTWAQFHALDEGMEDVEEDELAEDEEDGDENLQ
jgi:hypothetical protein